MCAIFQSVGVRWLPPCKHQPNFLPSILVISIPYIHNGLNPFSFSFLGSVVGNKYFEVPSWNPYLGFGFVV